MACQLVYYYNSFCYPSDNQWRSTTLSGNAPITINGIVYKRTIAPYSGCSGGQSDSYVNYTDASGTSYQTALAITSLSPHSINNYSVVCDASANPTYDCLNGNCIVNNNSNGYYKSLQACQAVCANGGACASGKQCVDPTTFCPDGKVCIEQGEYNSIQTLISKINSEVC